MQSPLSGDVSDVNSLAFIFFGFTAVVVTAAQHPHLRLSKVHIISVDGELILHTDIKDT